KMTERRNNGEKHTVEFQPVGRRAIVSSGETLLQAARSAGVELAAVCGGIGTCGKCRVRLITGRLTPPTGEEKALFSSTELSRGFRLACQASPLTDSIVDIPPETLSTSQRLQLEGKERKIDLDPVIISREINIPPPDFDNLQGDCTSLKDALKKSGVDKPSIRRSVLADISNRLRREKWKVRVALRGGEVVAVLPRRAIILGLAVDIGTTKIAAYLVELETGKTLAKIGEPNPQIAYGEDVVSRISYTNENRGGRKKMQSLVVRRLNKMISSLCSQTGTRRTWICEAVVVGNTAIHHLFTGLPVRQLGEAPYISATNESLQFSAREIGLRIAPGGDIFLPPNIAGYVGADHTAMLASTELGTRSDTVIALDIGTNTEISLIHRGRITTCSCASGPAFEGAHIQDGMRAADGAIERVKIMDGSISIRTVGDKPAVGICGSGILDAIAEMYKAGVVDKMGRINNDYPDVVQPDGRAAFRLVPAEETAHGRPIMVSRKDVYEVQLAKAAMRAGVDVLLKEAGIGSDNIDEFIVAGAFGSYIDVDNACLIGMFPELKREKFTQVGNAAGIGAKQILLSRARRESAERVARSSKYIELTVYPDFTSIYVQNLYFPVLKITERG
ncbi:MAG: ASKHA domain-containing protein, partial [Candidatus Auribacterota bacterium]|nr:ASKHA domain-containing protein [Candidatus Auribacterota bacterium]